MKGAFKNCISCAREFTPKASNTGVSQQKYCSKKCGTLKFEKKDALLELEVYEKISNKFIKLSALEIHAQRENIRMCVRRLLSKQRIIGYQNSSPIKSLNFKGDISLKRLVE